MLSGIELEANNGIGQIQNLTVEYCSNVFVSMDSTSCRPLMLWMLYRVT